MTHQDDFSAADTPAEQPAMELLDGAQAASPTRPSLLGRVARGSLYGVLLLSATALLAVSAVPELTNYLSFLPGDQPQGSCALSSGSCTALSAVSLENAQGSPCCPLQAAATEASCPLQAAVAETSGTCAKGAAGCASLASVSAELPACCLKDAACSEGQAACSVADASAEEASDEQLLDDEALTKLPPGEELESLED